MTNSNLENNYLSKENLFLLILYLSLIVGFIFNENSTGGAILDYINQKSISKLFAKDFFDSFFNYDKFSTRHSPILIIFLSIFEKLNFSDELIRIIHLHISLLLPFGFYICLSKKFAEVNKYYLLLLVGLIFLSPTFRSLAIWPDSRLLGLAFFTLSIYFYIKFIKDKKFSYCILNILFCSISSYISPNFSVFSIFFFYIFLNHYKLFSYQIISIIFLNIFLSLPALYYIFFLDINFFNKSAIISNENKNIFFSNFSNQILLISSIIFFYFFPFILSKSIKLDLNFKTTKFFISILIILICIIFFDYKYSYTGGGVFFKISFYIFGNNVLFYFISFISILVILFIIENKFHNILVFILIFLSNPQISVYHKYYDPLVIILLFTILSLNIDINKLKNYRVMIFLYSYFGGFLLLSFFK